MDVEPGTTTLELPDADDAALEALAPLAESLRVLRVRGPISNKALKAIAKLTALEELDLSGCEQLSGGLKPLADLPLRRLALADCFRLTAIALKALGGCTTLRVLDLGGCGVTDTALKAFTTLTELEELDIGWGPRVNQERGGKGPGGICWSTPAKAGLTKLKELPKLRVLRARWWWLSEAVPRRLAKCDALRELDLSHGATDPEIFPNLKPLKQLTSLTLREMNPGPIWKDLTQLERLDLTGHRRPLDKHLLRDLTPFTALRELTLPAAGVTDQALLTELRAALPDCQITVA